MENSKAVLNLYVAVLLGYSIMRFVISGPVIFSLRFVLVAWSFFYFLKTALNSIREPFFIKALVLLYIVLAIYGLVIIFEGKTFYVEAGFGRKVPSFLYLFNVSKSLLPIFAFYHFAKKGILTQEYIKSNILLFLVSVTLIFIFKFQQGQIMRETEEITNNAGYTVLSFMPMLVFLKDRSLKQYLFILFCILLVILAMKRGAIICMFFVLLIHLKYLFFKSGRKKLLSMTLALALLSAVSYYMVERLMLNSEHFQERIDDTLDGESSGRDIYYQFFYNYYLNQTTPQEFFFGIGANGTLEIWINYAHNDWLEIAINQGLLGLIVYLIFWLSFLSVCVRKKRNQKIAIVLWMLFTIYLLKTFFSMSYDQYTLYSSMALGYCIACSYRNEDFQLKLKKEDNHENY